MSLIRHGKLKYMFVRIPNSLVISGDNKDVTFKVEIKFKSDLGRNSYLGNGLLIYS